MPVEWTPGFPATHDDHSASAHEHIERVLDHRLIGDAEPLAGYLVRFIRIFLRLLHPPLFERSFESVQINIIAELDHVRLQGVGFVPKYFLINDLSI
jgi:hypothetical protein